MRRSTLRRSVAALILLAVAAAPARAAGSGIAWQLTTGGRFIIAAPAVGPDGTLYAAASDGVLYAVAPNGHVRWRLNAGITVGATPPARPAVARDGTSYWNLGGAVVAVTSAGRLRWVFLARGSGSPVLSRGHVLFAAGPYLYAINTTGAAAGQYAWRAAITAAGPTPAVGPDGTAYVPTPDGYLDAIAPNGLRRWSYRIGVALLYSPAVGLDGTVYLDAFANGHGTLYALHPNGRLRWRLSVPAGSDVTRGPDGTIYVASHLVLAISPRGRVLWRRVVDAAAPPLAAPGPLVLIATLSSPALLALGSRGVVRWRIALPAPLVAPPARGPGDLYYGGDALGTLSAVSPRQHGHTLHINGRGATGPPLDLGADNAPFIVRHGAIAWRVSLRQVVERSDDGGRHWRGILTPGHSTLDARTGLYHNARYDGVAFLALDPLAPRGLYVGTVGALGDYLSGGAHGADGGLYYSPNGTTGWQRLNDGLPFTYEPRLRVATFGLDSLVFDPARRGTLYAQTPVAFGSPGHPAGLYKSTDGGRHWRLAVRGLPAVPQGNNLIGPYRAYPPGALLVDRARTSVLFLVAPTGLYRSADSAGRWQRVAGVSYRDADSVAVRIGARGAVRIFTDRGTYVSGDYGAHFKRVISG